MRTHEVIRRAAAILTEIGWCQGANATGSSGEPLPLHEATTAGDGRVRINPRARAFSMYGAIAKALQEADTAVPQTGRMWEVLAALAREIAGTLPDKSFAIGHHSPVIHFNEHMDRTKDEVLALLEKAALTLEKGDVA